MDASSTLERSAPNGNCLREDLRLALVEMVKLFENTEYLNPEPVTEVTHVSFTLYMPDDVSKLSDEEKLALYESDKMRQYLENLTDKLSRNLP